MGSPCFYFYPAGVSGTLQVVSLGALRLSDLVVGTVRDTMDGYARTGEMYRDSGGSRQRVRIVCERFTDLALVRKLENMSSHLERGGYVGFVVDNDKLWGGMMWATSSSANRGTTAFNTTSNRWSTWNAGSLAIGDEVCIASSPPESHRDYRTLAATLASADMAVTLAEGLTYTSTTAPGIVRWRDFWPCLAMPGGRVDQLSERPIVSWFRRRGDTLDITLEEDWGALLAWGDTDSGGPGLAEVSPSFYAPGRPNTSRQIDTSGWTAAEAGRGWIGGSRAGYGGS